MLNPVCSWLYTDIDKAESLALALERKGYGKHGGGGMGEAQDEQESAGHLASGSLARPYEVLGSAGVHNCHLLPLVLSLLFYTRCQMLLSVKQPGPNKMAPVDQVQGRNIHVRALVKCSLESVFVLFCSTVGFGVHHVKT